MALEISGKVVQLLPEITGSGKNGTWMRRDFIVETTEQYPKKICFSGWGDKAAQVSAMQIGQSVKVSFNAESREFNGKWYTDLRAWKIDFNGGASEGGAPDYASNQPESAPDDAYSAKPGASDDLPF